MSKGYSVEYHPQKTKIQRSIINGESTRDIAKKYSTPACKLSSEAVRRYKDEKLPQVLRLAQLDDVDGVIDRINEYMITVDQFYTSIKHVLDNPENPGTICFYPRAEEIKVKWYDDVECKWKVGILQDLLNTAGEKSKKVIAGVYVNGRDPREYLLRTAEVLRGQLETMSKVRGFITENNTTVNIGTNTTVNDIANLMKEACAPWPDAVDAFVTALMDYSAKMNEEARKAMELYNSAKRNTEV